MAAPLLPLPPKEYDGTYMLQFVRTLDTYFRQIEAVRQLNAASINININSLPTEAALANLRSGDVNRDTTAGNALKVKP
jgi:hypothetical protein